MMTTGSQHNEGMSAGPPRFFAFVQLGSGTVLAGSCTRGMSRSRDRGVTWEPVEGLDHVSENGFALAGDGEVLVATSGGLARSRDDGVTWELLDDEPIYATRSDGADGPTGLTVYRFAQLPDGRVVAGTDGHGVWGRTGSEWSPLGLAGLTVFSLVVTPSGTLIAGTRGNHAARSTDGGATWHDASSGLPDGYVHCLAVHAGSIYAGTGIGLARSDDDGLSWTTCAEPLSGNRIFSLIALDDGTMLAGGYSSVWRGSGEAWQTVDPGLTPDESWAVHFDRDRVLAGTKAGIMASHDDGVTWSHVGVTAEAFNFLTTADGEVLAAASQGVLRAPGWEPIAGLDQRAWSLLDVGPDALLVGTLMHGLHRFDRTGWSRVEHGPGDPQIFGLLRTRSGALIATTGAYVDQVKSGGIFLSRDDGRTWTAQWQGKNVYGVVELSDGTLFAAARRCHILESTDGGLTWEACPPPVPHEAKTYSLSVDASDRLFLGAGGQLLRSDDRALTWTLLDAGIDGVSIYALGQSPTGALVAATNAGMFRSTDGGDSWSPGVPEPEPAGSSR